MARFDTSGIDGILNELDESEKRVQETVDAMLIKGAEIVEEEWKAAIERHGLVDSGSMRDRVGHKRGENGTFGEFVIEVYSKGKDKNGIRNTDKAFVLHHGTSRIDATHFVDDAESKAEGRVGAEFGKIWRIDEYVPRLSYVEEEE